jgi:DNA helicase IV
MLYLWWSRNRKNAVSNKDRRVALICFNAPLADFLEQHAKGVSFVGTFRAFCDRGLQDAKQKVGSGDEFEAYTRAQGDGLIKKFEAIVVDEGQDFEDIWWIALLDSIDNDGFLRVFFDDNQRVRKEGGSLPKELLPAVYLDDNVRNTRAVFDAFKGFYHSENKVLPAGPVGRKVEWLSLTTPSELAKGLGKMIFQLASVNRVKASDIVVLTPKDPQNSRLSHVTLPGTYRLTHSPPTDQNQVRWETVANFKGLEASVVIVVEADHTFLNTSTAQAMLYVAFSRPRSHLVVIGLDEDLKEIERLAADL